jgi:O-acetyl-ADP-ribose deacetylase (regulator of RNase III)
LAVEVWDTTCIVTNFKADILINSANPSLSGVSKFPYFPKGGPEPTQPAAKDAHHIMGYVTQWGGMEVGQGMMFAANVVDGLVHQIGGKGLRQELACVGNKCEEGHAVWTSVHSAGGDLQTRYPLGIIHTVPPFYEQSDNSLLKKCYWTSLDTARQQSAQLADQNRRVRLACPLLGAGCRGFPVDLALQSAAEALVQYDRHKDSESPRTLILAFAIPSDETRQALTIAFQREFGDAGVNGLES